MASPAEIQRTFSVLEQYHSPTMLEQLKNCTHFQLLVATMLSARSKDSTTIPIVKNMFAQYPIPSDYISMDLRRLEKLIYGVGFFRVKARNIQKLSKIIMEKYKGNIPGTVEELTSLPGVGRKTANCILNYVFYTPAIAVDTHVHRISNRLGWVRTKTPEQTEMALQKIVPHNSWSKVNMLLVNHGQRVCLPRNPKCEECPIIKYCEYGKERSR